MSYKIVTMGKYGSGKTCLINRWRFKKFDSYAPATVGATFAVINTNNVKIQIWDTAGNERYRSLTPMYLRGAHLIFYCVDCSEDFDIEYHKKSIDHIKDEVSGNTTISIIATKCDSINNNLKKIKSFAEIMNCDFTETSAKTGYNINELFNTTIEKLKDNIIVETNIIQLESPPKKSKCCYF